MKQAILRRGWRSCWRRQPWARCWPEPGRTAPPPCGSPCPAAPSVPGTAAVGAGDLLGLDGLSAATVLALGQSPVLLAGRSLAVQEDDAPSRPGTGTGTGKPRPRSVGGPGPQPGADNGVPAQTVDPRSTDGYSIINGVYIKNKSSRTLTRRCWETGSSRPVPSRDPRSSSSTATPASPIPCPRGRSTSPPAPSARRTAPATWSGWGRAGGGAVVLRHLRGPRPHPPRRGVVQRRL